MTIWMAKNVTHTPFIVTIGTTKEIALHNLQEIIGFELKANKDIDYRGQEQVFEIVEVEVLDSKITIPTFHVREYREGRLYGCDFDCSKWSRVTDHLHSRRKELNSQVLRKTFWVIFNEDGQVHATLFYNSKGQAQWSIIDEGC